MRVRTVFLLAISIIDTGRMNVQALRSVRAARKIHAFALRMEVATLAVAFRTVRPIVATLKDRHVKTY
jgi:hypothetical protein